MARNGEGVWSSYPPNNLIYDRLAPGVRDELNRMVARSESGRLKTKLFRGLTPDFGHPKLREHLGQVVMALKLSSTWDEFMATMDKHLKRYPKSPVLPFDGVRENLTR